MYDDMHFYLARQNAGPDGNAIDAEHADEFRRALTSLFSASAAQRRHRPASRLRAASPSAIKRFIGGAARSRSSRDEPDSTMMRRFRRCRQVRLD